MYFNQKYKFKSFNFYFFFVHKLLMNNKDAKQFMKLNYFKIKIIFENY